MPATYRHPMATRRPVNHPFAWMSNQARTTETPVVVIAWIKGTTNGRDEWSAEVVAPSQVDGDPPLLMRASAADLRPARHPD